MNMSLPKEVKIGWKVYKVVEKEPDHDLIKDGDNCYGQIHYDRQVIIINSSMSEPQKEATLFHEVLHGISEIFDIGLEEHQVSVLADALYIFKKDNEKAD